jgi:hypothetical protein
MSVDVPVPRTVLPILYSHNYHTWAIELQTLFEAKKLWDIVCSERTGSTTTNITGEDGRVTAITTVDPEFRYQDATIRSLLLSSVDATQRSHII